ncbi:myogenesis-regulating glycosidase [Aethina tumida]|uniref:myogenesis-regulating glycosidase n=1 Tax=Aethina tumida TaxID=116153 RepID=UPI0021481A12|nr:myogenesis-regulating glycosidase [Aethina tumida]
MTIFNCKAGIIVLLVLTSIILKSDALSVSLSHGSDGVRVIVSRDSDGKDVVLTGILGLGLNYTHNNPVDANFSYTINQDTVQIFWETKNTDLRLRDCYDLNQSTTNWFGGPERYRQVWPLEEMTIKASDKPYAVAKTDNFAVAEPYWLNSNGAFIYVDERTPLYVDQNNLEAGKVCFIADAQGVYVGRNRVVLNYTIGVQENAKLAHLFAVENFLGKPTGHPNDKMISEPIWTTWAKYKKEINDDVVLEFADDIVKHGYAGQLEIDDEWEKCYGHQEFSTIKFPNINETVKKLHEKNFRVTLWLHPFVDVGCSPNEEIGLEKGYFVKDKNGNTHADWWNTNTSHQIDFTQEEARKWYSDRVSKIKNHGIDSFKFDAGESDYANQPNVYPNEDIELVPNSLTSHYIRTVAKFGDLVEVRSAYKTQDLPIFLRMLDKDSSWGFENGLRTLVTTLLQLNMNGYTLVLPDMIGGNAYNGLSPDAELLVRWSQANVFMPAMQFSFLPWEIPSDKFDTEKLIKKTIDLHSEYSGEILKAMNESIVNGTPVNPPIWWVDPLDKVALGVNDEYLLGESILVAPVMDQGAVSRDVYLPVGSWKDGNTGEIFIGPINIENYSAPIDVLPYFIKQ